jgi:cytochrome P450
VLRFAREIARLVRPIKASFLVSPEIRADPHQFYARMRKDAPVFRISLPLLGRATNALSISRLFSEAWLLTRYDDVAAMLKDKRVSRDILAKLPWAPPFFHPLLDNMLGRDPPDHTRLRKLVSNAFTPHRIEQLTGRVEEVCEELLAAAPAGRPFDLVAEYALPLPLTIISELLGIPRAERRRFHLLLRESLALGVPTGRLLDLVRALPFFWMLSRDFRKLFAERRVRPRDDLFSALVQAEEAGDRLSADELLGTVTLLLFAGYETTVHLIASGTLALLQHPEARARFEQDASVADSAIEELLRYTSPLHMTTPRLTLEEVTYGSVTIPKGVLVVGVLGSANHDESQFVDPERLDLGREPNRHLAFGTGHHFCLGASLARLEARIALTTLFRRCPAMQLAQPAQSLRWRRSLGLRALAELPVRH